MSFSVDAWGQPFSQPTPAVSVLPPITTVEPVLGSFTGSATLLNGWFVQWLTPTPAVALPQNARQDLIFTNVPVVAITPPLTWFAPFSQPTIFAPTLPVALMRSWFGESFGMTLPESVHVQWWRNFDMPVLKPDIGMANRQFFTFGRLPPTPSNVSISLAGASLALSGEPAYYEITAPAQVTFSWDESYTFPAWVSPFVSFVGYDPFVQTMLVQFRSGVQHTYAPVSASFARQVAGVAGNGQDPSQLLSGVPQTQ